MRRRKKCIQLVSIISKMTARRRWEKKTKRVVTIVSERSPNIDISLLSPARDSEL